MWLRIVRALPWRMIIANTPKIVEAARSVYETRRRATPLPAIRAAARGSDTRELEHALSSLEEHATRQAAVVAQLAQQVEEMAAAIEVMRRRLATALTLSLVASGLAVLLAIVAVVR